MGAEIRAKGAREAARTAARGADRAEAGSVVGPDGGLRRARPAVPNHSPMRQRWPGLARGRMRALQDPRKPPAGCCPPAAGYADLEAGSLAEMPLMPERSVRAGRANDQAD